MRPLLFLSAATYLLGVLNTVYTPPWVSWHAEAWIFAGLLLLSMHALLKGLRVNRCLQPVAIPSSALPFLGLFVLVVFQLIFGQIHFFGQALVLGFYFVGAVFALMIGFCGVRFQEGRMYFPCQAVLMLLAWTILLAGIICAALALAQAFQVWDFAWILHQSAGRRPGANLGQPNHLATLLVASGSAVIYLSLTQRFKAYTVYFLLCFLGLGVVVTESRTGVLSIFVLLGWWLTAGRKFASHSLFGPLILVLAIIVTFFVWPDFISAYNEGVTELLGSSTSRFTESAFDPRLTVWPQLLEASLLKPWLGWGMGQTPAAHIAVIHLHNDSLPFSYSHNILIDLVIWIGWPLALALVILTLLWLWRCLPKLQNADAWFGFAVALPLMVHSLLEFPFAYAYLLFPALIGVGAAEAAMGRPPSFRVPGRVAAAFLAIFAALSAWTVVEYLKIEEEFRLARFAMLRIGPPEVSKPGFEPHLLTQLGAVLKVTRMDIKANMHIEDLELLRQVSLYTPWSAPRYLYAKALALNGQSDEAMRVMKTIRVQHGIKLYDNFLVQINDSLQSASMATLK